MYRMLSVVLAAALVPPAAYAQSPRFDAPCREPFVTSAGYVLTPQCPRRALLEDPLDFLLMETRARRGTLDLAQNDEQRFVPGTQFYAAPNPLRDQQFYSPGMRGAPLLSPREGAVDFVFGVRVPF
jgi:hypothetical protein